MTVKIQKLVVKVSAEGQADVPSEVLVALGAEPGEELEFAIYADAVVLRSMDGKPVKVVGLEEALQNAAQLDDSRFQERYTYYWSLRD